MTGALRTWNNLGPRVQALYLTALVASAALAACGVVLLASPLRDGRAADAAVARDGVAASGGAGDGPLRPAEGRNADYYYDVAAPTSASSLAPAPWRTSAPSRGREPAPRPPPAPPPTPSGQLSTSASTGPSTSQNRPAAVPPTEAPRSLTDAPAKSPTHEPTGAPSDAPTKSPTAAPTKVPTHEPTVAPSNASTKSSTATPTESPTDESTGAPSDEPTKSPTAAPTRAPTHEPTGAPSSSLPTEAPSIPPSTEPTFDPSPSPSSIPSASSRPSASSAPALPLFPTHADPLHPKPTYFNYNTTAGARYGPAAWDRVVLQNASNYWREFNFTENRCGREAARSPIDVCAAPRRHCKEHHEFRSKRGDFQMRSVSMTQQILPDKLRVLVDRRVGEEPDPPHVDFAGVGVSNLDLLHIDLKFPAEHTVCGRRYEGEMRYYFFHPKKRALLVVAWLLEAQEGEGGAGATENRQMQYLIDEFQALYDRNEAACSRTEEVRRLSKGPRSATSVGPTLSAHHSNATHSTASGQELSERRQRARRRRKKGGARQLARIWDPFHPDIQRTIHFWGYTGSLTEPPCSDGTLWRVMDVPVRLAAAQLRQLRRILFDNRDGRTCARTSTHYRGSVARPRDVTGDVRYYKCTRSDYVSDDERAWCGDAGCEDSPFGKGFHPYVEPIVAVTGPPSEAPTASTLSVQSP